MRLALHHIRERRQQLVQQSARPLGAQRPRAPGEPRLPDRVLGMGRQGGGHHVPRRLGQDAVEDRADPLQVAQQLLRACIGVHAAEKLREPGKPGAGVGQRMGLPVGHHLQPVLGPPQHLVGVGEYAQLGVRQMPGDARRIQGRERRRLAQRGIAAAPDQLQRLCAELDLAYAAVAQLEIVAQQPRLRVTRGFQRRVLVIVHPRLHCADIGDGGEIEMPPPDEGSNRVEEAPAQRQIARDRPRLDHRRPFQVCAAPS